MLSRVHENGFVYEGTYEGWYCPRCADFKAENEIDDGNRCPIHHIELTREQEENYFFRLSAFQEPLEAAVRRARGLRRAAHALQRGAVVHPLGPARRPADAHKLTWGVPVPWDSRARLLRVVRRAAQLLHRALLRAGSLSICARELGGGLGWRRARRRGARRRRAHGRVLAGHLPPDRQGHPALPRGLLAGAA